MPLVTLGLCCLCMRTDGRRMVCVWCAADYRAVGGGTGVMDGIVDPL